LGVIKLLEIEKLKRIVSYEKEFDSPIASSVRYRSGPYSYVLLKVSEASW
jgi:hypothetical protein